MDKLREELNEQNKDAEVLHKQERKEKSLELLPFLKS